MQITRSNHDGADGDAIHDNVDGEIAAIAEKVSPVAADLLLIEDSAASNAKKRVQVGNLPGAGTTIEAGQVDGTTGAVEFRWGIDSTGRPYFDSTSAVIDAEAARIYMGSDGRIYAEDLPV